MTADESLITNGIISHPARTSHNLSQERKTLQVRHFSPTSLTLPQIQTSSPRPCCKTHHWLDSKCLNHSHVYPGYGTCIDIQITSSHKPSHTHGTFYLSENIVFHLVLSILSAHIPGCLSTHGLRLSVNDGMLAHCVFFFGYIYLCRLTLLILTACQPRNQYPCLIHAHPRRLRNCH